MTTTTPAVTWGEALQVKTNRRLKMAVEAISAAVGPVIGSRNTFAKLYTLDEAPRDSLHGFRAWLLLTAVGLDPSEWGLDDDVVPPAYDVVTLRELVLTKSRCIWGFANQGKLPFEFELACA